MTRTGITWPFLSKFVEGLIMLFNCLLDLHPLIFRTGLFLISMCQHRSPMVIVHSSACLILRTTMAEIRKWTFKWTRLVDTSFSTIFFIVNSQPFIYATYSPSVVHFLIMHHFLLLCFDQDRAQEYRTQFLHYFLFHRLI
jgi:hypothetical protein